MMSSQEKISKDNLLSRIGSRTAIVGIVGLGYVGLPLLIRFAESGFKTIGFDIDVEKIARFNRGLSYIKHIPDTRVQSAQAHDAIATDEFAKLSTVDAIIICVPTPLTKNRTPDLSFITDTVKLIRPHLRPGQVISLESTTYPGTTEEEVIPRLTQGGLTAGKNLFVVYSPEREDPGNLKFETKNIPKIVGGYSSDCLAVGHALYSAAVDEVVTVSSLKAAEMTKLLENIHRAVNIGLVNELKIVADKMNIDILEVINAAATKPFGFTPYFPGPGLGGHCIPIDPFYLTWKAKEYGVTTRFIELAGEVNTAMPHWVVGKVVSGLNSISRSVKGSRILILGLAYKKNIDDSRESPAVEIWDTLRALSANVEYSDPYIPNFEVTHEGEKIVFNSIPLCAKTLNNFDAVIVATDHACFDYQLIFDNARLIIDTRGVFRRGGSHVIRA